MAMKRDKPELFQMTSEHQAGGLAQARRAPQDSSEPARLSIDGQLVRVLLKSLGEPPVRISLWNGDSLAPAAAEEVAHVRIASRASLLKLIVDPAFQFGECYCDGSIEVDGGMVELLEVLIRALSDNASSTRQLIDWSRRRRANTLANSRDNIHSHYDLGNAFYALWLDRELAYTSDT